MGRITVIGLGPAGPELLTSEALAAIESIPTQYLRTVRHPAASALVGAASFDHLYDTHDTFEDVYRTIADHLAAQAGAHGEVLYAVPGSPWVLERSVRLLLERPDVSVRVLAGVSFLELAYARLGVDPIEAGVRLVDGHVFATAAAGQVGPLLVAHCHNRRVLSDIKLAVDVDGETPVVVLQRLGLADEAVFTVPWSELDRSFEPDHLTAIYVAQLAGPVGAEMIRLYETIARLRVECPWDRKQTHESLARYALEEAYEVVEAIGELHLPTGDDHLAEELGDLLLQVVLHSAIGEQEGRFTLADVAAGITDKMIRRHPHVFGDVVADHADEVVTNWEQIKAAERASAEQPDGRPSTTGGELSSSVAGVDGHLPALTYASEMTKRAAKAGFDWEDPRGTLDKVREELDEVSDAWDDPVHIGEEIGDVLFAAVSLARHRGVDPEVALRQATAKFARRVRAVESLAITKGLDTRTAGLTALDELWAAVKADERAVAGD